MKLFILSLLATCLLSTTNLSAAQGLNFNYYEGTFSSLPDFNTLTPAKSGTGNNIDLSIRNRDISYAILWEGSITIPAAGTYTFETSSDDGSKLYIGNYDANATALVNNDGLHGTATATGAIYLSAGTYPIAVSFFQNGGGQTMEMYWSSNTGIARQRIPDNALSTKAAKGNLNYSYYEGTWTAMPDFNTVNPVKTGTTNNIGLDVRNRDNSYAILWQGFITIAASGNYTFETNSDDGSKLYIGTYSANATPLVNNDGLHGDRSVTGSTYLSAGTYPITVSFFQNGGGQTMEMYWSSTTGIARQRIPDNVLTNNAPVAAAAKNLNYSYYEGTWSSLPDFNALTPIKSGTASNVDLSIRNRDNSYGIIWKGTINIPVAGTYTFETNSDDGSRLYIGNYSSTASSLVNNDGLHANVTATGTMNLAAGNYPITITFFQNGGGQTMELYWSSNTGISRQRIPDNVFTTSTQSLAAASSLPDLGGSGGLTGLTNYYLSSTTGDDSRTSAQAQNPATPWKTLGKLNAFMSNLKPGDAVLFKRGDVFDGALTLKSSGTSTSPIIFSSYGTGSKPVINGFTTLTNWVSLGNGVWQSNCAACATNLNMVTIDDVSKAMGRYPNADAANSGYLTFESHTGSSITDNQLTGAINWTGGELVIRNERWIIDRNPIEAHFGNTIFFTPTTVSEPKNNWGYFIQNSPKTLDQYGEWYYEPNSKNLQVYFGTNNPSTSVVKATAVPTLFTMLFINNIIFDNLAIQGSNTNSFDINTSNNIQVTNCDMNYSGGNAVIGGASNFFKMENSTITNSNNNAIFFVYDCSNHIIRGNTIKNTGLFAGMGASSDGSYQGIQLAGDNNLIELNTVENTGYSGITLNGDYTIVKNNFVNQFNMTKDDGGGIYSASSGNNIGRQMIGNIVLNGVGAQNGAGDGMDNISSFGIYMDNNSNNIKVSGNTVANCSGAGVIFLNAHDINFQNNTVYNNRSQLLLQHGNAAVAFVNNTLQNNILFSRTANQNVANLISGFADVAHFASYDYNYYCRPVSENTMMYINSPVDNLALNLNAWKGTFGQDANSQKSPFTVSDVNNIRFEYNATATNKTITLDGTYVDVKNNKYANTITLAPFTSAILMKQPLASIAPKDNDLNQASAAKAMSITEAAKTLNITVSPNPVVNQMNIKITVPQATQKATIMVHSISGVTLKMIPVTAATQNVSLDVASWNSGSYVISLVCDGQTISKQAVKL